MQKTLFRLLVVLLALVAFAASAEPLDQYVRDCKTSVGLDVDTLLPALDCNKVVRFAFNGSPGGPGLVNDFLGYKRISNYVDLTFACRWLANKGTGVNGSGPFATAASLELMIHNRQNGNTCFFAAKSTNGTLANGVSTSIVSLTDANASNYWMAPTDLNSFIPNSDSASTFKCVGCHVAGPYIASPRIAPYLAQYGLLNNGHNTLDDNYHAVNSGASGSAFNGWNAVKDGLLTINGCTNGCHAIGSVNATPCPPGLVRCPVPAITGNGGQTLIPSLFNDITDVSNAGVMPLSSTKNSDYRWMNVDIPDDPNSTGDVELYASNFGFAPALNAALSCNAPPASMEARVVGSPNTYRTDQYTAASAGFPDKLEEFDPLGLVCRNASQPGGMCSNYTVRFICRPDQLSVYSVWTNRVLTIANPDANQIRWAKGQPSTPAWYGSQTWHIEGVNDGVHYNYVRFRNDWSGTYLNADISLSIATAGYRDWWLSEQWVMEYVAGTPYVRFRNLWQPGYLTMVDSSDYSAVNLQPLHTDSSGNPNWTSQEWLLQ